MNTEKYLLQADCGTTPPKYVHDNIFSASEEAKRLHKLLNTNVKILKVVGEVKFVEVPVTRTESKLEIFGNHAYDDLPF